MYIQIKTSKQTLRTIRRLCKKKRITKTMFFRMAINNHIEKLKSEKGFFSAVKEKPKKIEPYAEAFTSDDLSSNEGHNTPEEHLDSYQKSFEDPTTGPTIELPKCRQCGVELTPGNVNCNACGYFNI